ncbi:6184_t:CDS:2 [Entrophospora sp. SA101]|nr:6184_t:CDS:2 [Entrophospora sp. SA101]
MKIAIKMVGPSTVILPQTEQTRLTREDGISQGATVLLWQTYF